MIRSTVRHLLAGKLAGEQRGGAALFMLLAFMVLAVPLVLAATQVAGQLARNSQVYETRLTDSYAGASDVEFAISEILNPESDGIPDILAIPGEINWDGDDGTDVRVYKVTPDIELLGQGLVVTQAVEYTAPVGDGATFTYTLTIRNEGSTPATLEKIVDYLPPGLSYQKTTEVDITQSQVPSIDFPVAEPQVAVGNQRCGQIPQQVTWGFAWASDPPNDHDQDPYLYPAHLHLNPQHRVTLTFEAIGAFPANENHTYYNRATADYRARWDGYSTPIEVSTPYGAEFPVGSGIDEACGYDLFALIGDTTFTGSDLLGVAVDVDYTIKIENVSEGSLVLEKVFDTLPPGFCYEPGTSKWTPAPGPEPASVEDCLSGRSQITWNPDPPYAMAPNDTVTVSFVATGVVQAGVSYFNDISAVFTSSEQSGKADIVLALDNRRSIEDEDLALLKQAANEIINRLNPPTNDGNIRFGVTRFFGCSVSVVAMTADAGRLKHGGGASYDGSALPEWCEQSGKGNGANVAEPGVVSADSRGVTTFTVTDVRDFVEDQTIIVDGEHMKITAIAVGDSKLTVMRGQDSTTPVSHAVGASVLIFHGGPDLGIDNIQPGFDLFLGTNLVAALYGAEAQFKSGGRERPDVPRSIIIISNFDDNSPATIQAIQSVDIDAEIFAVGIVGDENPNSQAAVASEPASDHMFTATNFSDLLEPEFIDGIVAKIPLLLTATGGTSSATAVSGGTLYDIESVDAEGNSGLRSRVLLRQGAVEILSWQEK